MSDVELSDCIREACREAGLDPTRHLSPEVGVRRLVAEIVRLKARAEEAERKADIAATEWAATMNAARIDHVATVAAESRATSEAANGAALRTALQRVSHLTKHACVVRLMGDRAVTKSAADALVAALEHAEVLLDAAPSDALARVQGLVDLFALVWREMDAITGGSFTPEIIHAEADRHPGFAAYRAFRGIPEPAPGGTLTDAESAGIDAALDAFTGTTATASTAPLPCWLVWRMDDPAKGVYLVAVDTSPEIADRHKRAFEAEAEMMNRWRRVIVEESRLDHAFGESISKDLPRTGTNTGDANGS